MVLTRRAAAAANTLVTKAEKEKKKEKKRKSAGNATKDTGRSKEKSTGSKVRRKQAAHVVSEGPYRDPPKDWEVVYDLFVELRKDRSAPVDDCGSEAVVQEGPHKPYQTVIALMLSKFKYMCIFYI